MRIPDAIIRIVVTNFIFFLTLRLRSGIAVSDSSTHDSAVHHLGGLELLCLLRQSLQTS